MVAVQDTLWFQEATEVGLSLFSKTPEVLAGPSHPRSNRRHRATAPTLRRPAMIGFSFSNLRHPCAQDGARQKDVVFPWSARCYSIYIRGLSSTVSIRKHDWFQLRSLLR